MDAPRHGSRWAPIPPAMKAQVLSPAGNRDISVRSPVPSETRERGIFSLVIQLCMLALIIGLHALAAKDAAFPPGRPADR